MFPAALMVMVILGAIVVDVVFTTIRGRELRRERRCCCNSPTRMRERMSSAILNGVQLLTV